jgi:hypothetical protein
VLVGPNLSGLTLSAFRENEQANSWQSQNEYKSPIPDIEWTEHGPERTKPLRHNDNQAKDNDE